MSTAPALPTLAARIRAALLAVALVAVAVAALGALVIGHLTLHRQLETHLAAISVITASQSQAPLLFRDAAAALDVLRAIPAEEGIRLAEIRDANGAVLARLERGEKTLPGWVEHALAPHPVSHPVTVDGRTVGEVVLEAGAWPLADSLVSFLVYDLIGVLVMTLVVFAVARRLTRHIASPIHALGDVMREVHADADYARRAPPFDVAEIESLRTEFNALLEEIQRRDQALQRTNAALKRLALRDPLTGLANRAMFETALLDALGREDGAHVGLLYFDLDAFKAVNDTFGHAVGDELLRTVAARLAAHVPANAVAARIGGDEFVVLLPGAVSPDALRALAERLQQALQAPLRAGAHVLHPGASVGHALSVAGMEAAQLIDLADRAMYAAKARRRDTGHLTRWARAADAVETPVSRRRVRDSAPIKTLGERDVQIRSA